MAHLTIDNLEQHVGAQISQSEWATFSQAEVNEFARVTRDPDPMHVDPEWATHEGPFGRTIMAGFSTLSLLPHLARQAGLTIGGAKFIMNYGFNHIRFVSPITVGQRFRNTMVLKSLEVRPDSKIVLVTHNTIEIEGSEKPAMVADWVNLIWR